MKKCLFLLISAFYSFVSHGQPLGQSLTRADYDRAVAHLGNQAAAVLSSSDIRPQWLANGRLGYRSLENGVRQYITLNPQQPTQKIVNEEMPGNGNSPVIPNHLEPLSIAPDGQQAVFIRNWNLWWIDLRTGKEKPLTQDGLPDFGYATDNAGWKHSNKPIVLWSPDSKKVASFQQDQRHVKDMYLVNTKVGAPDLEKWKYPLPGDSAIIKIHRVIIDVASATTLRLKMAPDDRRGTLCDDIACDGILGDNEWSADGQQLAFVSVSRDHKKAWFRIANTRTGVVREVFEEVVPTQYESGQGAINWKFLPETQEAIWYSERSGWGHLYLYDLKTGKLKYPITSGDFVVTKIIRVDASTREIIFEAKGREPGENPYFSHFYKVKFSGKELVPLTPEPGNHSISFSPDGQFFTDKYSTPVHPPITTLRHRSGKLLATLNSLSVTPFLKAGWVPPQLFTVKSANRQFDLFGLLFQPSQLNTQKKYPVVVYIYPGPQGGSVGSWSFSPMRRDHQAMAELGFIVVALEGSCNPNRSKAFHDACYGSLFENTLPDQIAGLQQLAATHPYMDLDRVGIWGHSGGGNASATALFKYPDFFKVGVAQSGNHDNRSYEDDWGERYIGLLEGDNYAKQANQTIAKNLKGKLLIAHGGMDDNVPPYNSYLVVDALIKANKDFDLIIFPNARHGYGADNNYMMRRRWDYFVKNLLGVEPPPEYLIKTN